MLEELTYSNQLSLNNKTVLQSDGCNTVFLCNRKLRFHYIKKLREDRTAADKKYVAYCDPPQAENLASEILFYCFYFVKQPTDYLPESC